MQFIFLIIVMVSCGHASSSTSIVGNPIAGYYTPQTLFDQSSLETNPSFRRTLFQQGYAESDLPAEDIECGLCQPQGSLEEICEAEFFKRRRWMYARAMFQETVSLGSVALIMIPVFFAGIQSQNPQISLFSGLAMSTAFLYLVYNSATLRGILAAWLFPGNDPILPYEREYARRKPELTYLDRQEQAHHFRLGSPNRCEQEFWTARQGLLNPRASIMFLQTLINVPTRSQPPILNRDLLGERLELYHPEEAHKILRICELHVKGFRHQLGLNDTDPQFMTLISSPGIGKTTLIKSIGDSMSLPVYTLDLTAATPDKLIGTKDDPGLLLTALCKLKIRNGILFIDEFCHIAKNEMLLASLLTTLDPSRKCFYSPYLEMMIDLSHLFIIIAGNESLSLPALLDRFSQHKTIRLEIYNHELYAQILEQKTGLRVREHIKGSSFRDDLARLQMGITSYF